MRREYISSRPSPVLAEDSTWLVLPGLMNSGAEEVVPPHGASGQQLLIACVSREGLCGCGRLWF